MKETKLLQLTSDIVFKSFMMSKNTNEYKAKLIHLITGIPIELLKNATYESNELKINNKKDKMYKTDILVVIDNHIINIEMNKYYYEGLFDKNVTYYNKLRSESFDRGRNYLDLKKIIQINIDDFHKFNGDKLVYKFMMMEVETKEVETNSIESYHIDLSYMKNKCYNEVKSELEKLCLLFLENKDIKELIKGDDIMSDAYEEFERISSDEKIIGLYDQEAVEQKVINTRIDAAVREAKKEAKEELVLKMLEENIDESIISNITGLSIEELEKL